MRISASVRNPDRVGGIARGLSACGARCQDANNGQNDQVGQRNPWSCTAVGLIADVGARVLMVTTGAADQDNFRSVRAWVPPEYLDTDSTTA